MSFNFGVPGSATSKTVNILGNPFKGKLLFLLNASDYSYRDHAANNVFFTKDFGQAGLNNNQLIAMDDNEHFFGGYGTNPPRIFKFNRDAEVIKIKDLSSIDSNMGYPEDMALTHNGNIMLSESNFTVKLGKNLAILDYVEQGNDFATPVNSTDNFSHGFYPLKLTNQIFFVIGVQIWRMNLDDLSVYSKIVDDSEQLSIAITENGVIYAVREQSGDIKVFSKDGTQQAHLSHPSATLVNIDLNKDFIVISDNSSQVFIYDRSLNEKSYSPISVNANASNLWIDNVNRIYTGNDGSFNGEVYNAEDGTNLAVLPKNIYAIAFPYRHYSAFNP